jgi:23S rRNA (guanosine2251-2'-O)-methyltransferase
VQEIKKSTRQILESNRKRQSPLKNKFILCAHNIRSMHNVGSLFRSADAFGVHSLWLSGFTPNPPRPEISKTALGAETTVNWKKIEDINQCIYELKEDGYQICGLEQTFESKLLTTFQPETEKICLILGNEVTGINDELIPRIDHFLEIPQFGEKHSLNVSVAAGIGLYAFLDKME